MSLFSGPAIRREVLGRSSTGPRDRIAADRRRAPPDPFGGVRFLVRRRAAHRRQPQDGHRHCDPTLEARDPAVGRLSRHPQCRPGTLALGRAAERDDHRPQPGRRSRLLLRNPSNGRGTAAAACGREELGSVASARAYIPEPGAAGSAREPVPQLHDADPPRIREAQSHRDRLRHDTDRRRCGTHRARERIHPAQARGQARLIRAGRFRSIRRAPGTTGSPKPSSSSTAPSSGSATPSAAIGSETPEASVAPGANSRLQPDAESPTAARPDRAGRCRNSRGTTPARRWCRAPGIGPRPAGTRSTRMRRSPLAPRAGTSRSACLLRSLRCGSRPPSAPVPGRPPRPATSRRNPRSPRPSGRTTSPG